MDHCCLHCSTHRILLSDDDDSSIWGMVIHAIHHLSGSSTRRWVLKQTRWQDANVNRVIGSITPPGLIPVNTQGLRRIICKLRLLPVHAKR